MNKRIAIALLLVVALAAMLGSTGCRRVRLEDVQGPTGLETTTKAVALDGAEKLDARVRMAAGELTLAGGSTGALDAKFDASPRSWMPEVEYSVEGTAGVLRISQPEITDWDFMGNTVNVWDMKLASGVPTELDIELGAGQSTLDLTEVDVRNLHVLTGAGETTIDLSGERANDIDGSIEAGVGELTLKVPQDVGVRVTGTRDGVGDYNVEGFTSDGDAYVNDAWDTATVKIDLRLQRGIGEVTVEQVP